MCSKISATDARASRGEAADEATRIYEAAKVRDVIVQEHQACGQAAKRRELVSTMKRSARERTPLFGDIIPEASHGGFRRVAGALSAAALFAFSLYAAAASGGLRGGVSPPSAALERPDDGPLEGGGAPVASDGVNGSSVSAAGLGVGADDDAGAAPFSEADAPDRLAAWWTGLPDDLDAFDGAEALLADAAETDARGRRAAYASASSWWGVVCDSPTRLCAASARFAVAARPSARSSPLAPLAVAGDVSTDGGRTWASLGVAIAEPYLVATRAANDTQLFSLAYDGRCARRAASGRDATRFLAPIFIPFSSPVAAITTPTASSTAPTTTTPARPRAAGSTAARRSCACAARSSTSRRATRRRCRGCASGA